MTFVLGTLGGTAASIAIVLLCRHWFQTNEDLVERLNVAILVFLVLVFSLAAKVHRQPADARPSTISQHNPIERNHAEETKPN